LNITGDTRSVLPKYDLMKLLNDLDKKLFMIYIESKIVINE